MDSTTNSTSEEQHTPKPRFFVPQPVHVDYMNALDNLRNSRSTSSASLSPRPDIGRPPVIRDKIYEAAKDHLPPDSAFFNAGEYHAKEKAEAKAFTFKLQHMRPDISKRSHIEVADAPAVVGQSLRQSLLSGGIFEDPRKKQRATDGTQEAQSTSKKRKIGGPCEALAVSPEEFDAKDGHLAGTISAQSAPLTPYPPMPSSSHVRSQSTGDTVNSMGSLKDQYAASVARTPFSPSYSSPTRNPNNSSSLPSTYQQPVQNSQQDLVESVLASMYPSSQDTSVPIIMPSHPEFPLPHAPSLTYQPTHLQHSYQDLSQSHQNKNVGRSQCQTVTDPYGTGYPTQARLPTQAWNDYCNFMLPGEAAMDGYANHNHSVDQEYAPFDGACSPSAWMHPPYSYPSIQRSYNALRTKQAQGQATNKATSVLEPPKARITRGLSPESQVLQIASEESLGHLGTQFSQPTVPNLSDFQFPTSAMTSQNISHDLIQSKPISIHSNNLSSTPNSQMIFDRKQPHSSEKVPNFQQTTASHAQHNLFNHATKEIPLGSPMCDVPCDGDCDSVECTTCDGSQICCEPCINPDLCFSGDCDDPKCFEEPSSICTGHHTPGSFYRSSMTPATPEESYVNPSDLLLDCHWETSGQQCAASMPSFNSLSEHVLQNHIQPQTVLPCKWNSCSDQIVVDEIPDHVWHYHSPTPKADLYVCLWHGCCQYFSSTEDLDAHMKAAHCRMSCHWDGCQQATTNEMALKAHVDQKHITEAISHSSTSATPSSCLPDTPKTGPFACMSHSSSPVLMSKIPLSTRSADDAAFCPPKNAGEKTCLWTGYGSSRKCGETFANGNDLQVHIEEHHVPSLKASGSATSKIQDSMYPCQWHGCKHKSPFSERSKLARHIYIHTRYIIGSCEHCGKEFNNQNQLNDHERTHTKETPFTCETCGFKATNKPALTTHMRTHTGEKPLKCDKCSYTCGDPSNMSKHRKIHEAPLYKCELCEKAFCRMATLKRHMLSHDSGKSRRITQDTKRIRN